MILNIVAAVFVLAITFVHSIFGLYGGVLNVFCSVTALTVAFGFFEPVSKLVIGTGYVSSSYAPALVLVLLFAIALLALRMLADNFLRGNVHVPMYLDWAGGGLCGFVNAQIAVGVMAIGLLMLPFGDSVLGFSRTERDPQNETDPATGRVVFQRNNLWFRSDAFAVGIFDLVSSGSLRGTTNFSSVYPDFPEWVWWSGNQVQQESMTAPEKVEGFDSGVAVESWWEQKEPLTADETRYRKAPPTKENPKVTYDPLAYKLHDAGDELIGVRVALKSSAADHEKDSSVHRFRPTVLRVVGDVILPDGSPVPHQFTPQVIGGGDLNLGSNYRIVESDDNFSLPAGASEKLDLFFEVPAGFKPRFIEYRRFARAALGAKKDHAPDERLSRGEPPGPGGPAKDKTSGIARFIDTVVKDKSGGIDKLPFPMSASKLSSNSNVTLRDKAVAGIEAGNRLSGEKKDYAGTGSDVIDKIKAPEGKRIIQIQTKTRKMESIAGKALNFVAATVNQYHALDKKGGTQYPLAGYYALVKRGGQDYFEYFYTPTPEESGWNGMIDVSQETRKALRDQDDAILGLIFVVPPGTCISAIESQGGKVELGKELCAGN